MKIPEPIRHTIAAIWETYERSPRSSDNAGVAMSQASNECARAIWYGLRWAYPLEIPSGQKRRRFNTGLIEEERLLDDLEKADIKVERLDPATGVQFRVELADGWLRGKLDGKTIGLPEAPLTEHIVECKSHSDKSFIDLKKKGVQKSKPDHWAQCQLYMRATGLKRTLYIAVNKNDDALYTERIEYDRLYAEQLEKRIAHIMQFDKPPPKLHEDPNARNAFQCGWCPARGVCHEKAWPRVNCRTCLESRFLPNAVVHCTLWDKDLTYEEQQKGCEKHLYLPGLILGEQVDADTEKRTVTYRLHDDLVWVDESKGD
jgi:hypothetical protein